MKLKELRKAFRGFDPESQIVILIPDTSGIRHYEWEVAKVHATDLIFIEAKRTAEA